jgi:hypothetical protein
MTQPDDDLPPGTPEGWTEPEAPFDEDAAWRLIIENYGDRPDLGDGLVDPDPDPGTATPGPGPAPAERDLFDRSYLDALEAQPADDPVEQPRTHEEHFVPPEPPPLPRGTPARRLAWCGLFGAPLMMLAAVVFGLSYPMWVSIGLVGAFVGGFVFLVATMPRDGGDHWGDGAVV